MCGEVEVPVEHLDACRVCNATGQRCGVYPGSTPGEGIPDFDFVFYVSAIQTERCNKSLTVAYASHCQQESGLDSGTKSKSKKEKSKETNHDNHLTEDGQEAENLPVLNRRLSLSKSGRMKEKKRSNISVMQTNLDGSCKETNNRKPSLNTILPEAVHFWEQALLVRRAGNVIRLTRSDGLNDKDSTNDEADYLEKLVEMAGVEMEEEMNGCEEFALVELTEKEDTKE
ncbi:hypothetical protein HUJ05_002872 [Dendroctonus ponderosae]|nr:hypothetical protein HUJ05_002872 [Dendroctonus ponderosae]